MKYFMHINDVLDVVQGSGLKVFTSPASSNFTLPATVMRGVKDHKWCPSYYYDCQSWLWSL